MPFESDGTTGSAGSVCQVSPGDEKAIIGNLISRLRNIETFLACLVAADVYANNLAELARDMGNLVNGSIMLPASPNSPWAGVGGTIPVPEGFTGSVINGNVLSMWNNGVFSIQLVGNPIGGGTPGLSVNSSPVVTVATAGVSDFITLVIDNQDYQTWQAGGNQFDSVVESAGSSFTWDTLNKVSFPAGLYWSGGSATIEYVATGEYSISYGGDIRRTSNNALLYHNGVSNLVYKAAAGTIAELYSPGFIFYTSVASNFQMGFSAGDPTGDIQGYWTIARLG